MLKTGLNSILHFNFKQSFILSKIKLKQSFNCILNAFKALKHAAVYICSLELVSEPLRNSSLFS